MTQGYFAKIDPEDFEDISQYKWRADLSTTTQHYYAKRNVSKLENGGNRTTEFMHRRIMNVASAICIDHINGDGLDNRKQNLRIADKAQNGWNQKIRTEGKTSRYKGVTWNTTNNLWQAQVRYRTKYIYLGGFKKEKIGGIDVGEIDAANKYDEAATKYFGTFARLNFPEEQKMSYVMDEKTKEKTEKRIKEFRGLTKGEISEILENESIESLDNMCKFLQCNISELSTEIKRYEGHQPRSHEVTKKSTI